MSARAKKAGFFSQKIWELDPVAVGGTRGVAVRLMQLTAFVLHNFLKDNAMLRASSLAFTTVLSIVPLLALAFSLLKGFGVQNRLAPLILQQVAAGSEVVVTRVITYINNTNMGSLGAIGLAGLIVTVVNMLGSIEDTFNAVWGVSETRSLYRKFSDYLSVLVVAPLLLLAATSITGSMQSQSAMGWLLEHTYLGDLFLLLLGFAPYLSAWLALFLLYMFMPNARVRFTSALLGAVIAGTLWEIAQWGYIHFQVGVANYNAIYGTLAALPILMVWIYLSWLIVLFGMEVVAVHQNSSTFRREIRGDRISQSLKELVALASLRHIALAFHQGEAGWGEERLAQRLCVPLRVMRATLTDLREAGFIVATSRGSDAYYPSRELDQITLEQVLLSLRAHGAACHISGEEQVESVLERVDRAVAGAVQGETLKTFALTTPRPPRH